MMTKHEQELYQTARKIPSDILAMAAKDQAENFVLSEATALDIAAAFGEAAHRARERRLYAATLPTHPVTYNTTIAGWDNFAGDRLDR